MITLDTADPTPPYEQVREQIAALIRSGQLASGHRLPSVRQLAADLRAAPGTVARAYRLLEVAGLVDTSRATGTRVLPGKAVPDHVTVAVRTLINALADEGVHLDDVLAALRTSWPEPVRDRTHEANVTSAQGQTQLPEPSIDPVLFVAAVMEHLANRDPAYEHGDQVQLVGTGFSTANEPLIVYRESPQGPLVGLRVDLTGFASLFKPDPNESELAQIIVGDVLADPSGPGPTKDADLDQAVLGADAGVGWRYLTA